MKKSTKGAIAAAAAGVLLLGGAGSLAYWTASGDADGGSITSGTLTLSEGVCGDWTYAAGSAGATGTVELFVPGDVVTNTCSFLVGATGDNLVATIGTPASIGIAGTGSFEATVVTTYDLGGSFEPGTDKVTSANDGGSLEATFVVTIPHGTDETGTPLVNANDTQGITAALDSLTVTLTQDDPQL